MPPSVTTSVVNQVRDFTALKERWDVLLNRSSCDSPFLSHEWLHAWWSFFGQRTKLHIVLFEKAGELVGLFPGYRKRYLTMGPYMLHFLGDQKVGSDMMDLIVAQGCERETLAAFNAHLGTDRTLAGARLRGVDSQSRFVNWTGPHGWFVKEKPAVSCPVLELGPDSGAGNEGLSISFRKKLRYYRKRLDQLGAHLEVVDTPRGIIESFVDFVRLHQLRRHQKAQTGVFKADRQKFFYQQLLNDFSQRGWVELAFLNVEGERVAGVLQFSYREGTFYYQTGFDPSWVKYSVGLVLNRMLIERAEQQGMKTFNFLRGDEPYKYRLGATDRAFLHNIDCFRFNWLQRLDSAAGYARFKLSTLKNSIMAG